MTLEETLRRIVPADRSIEEEAWRRWDSIAKPLRGLGLLEEAVARIAGMTRTVEVDLSRRAVAVFCADNGVAVSYTHLDVYKRQTGVRVAEGTTVGAEGLRP